MEEAKIDMPMPRHLKRSGEKCSKCDTEFLYSERIKENLPCATCGEKRREAKIAVAPAGMFGGSND